MKQFTMFLPTIVALMVFGCEESPTSDPVSSSPVIAQPVSGGGPITQKKGRFEFFAEVPDGGLGDGCGMPLVIKGAADYSLASTLVHASYEVAATAKLATPDGRTVGKVDGAIKSQIRLSKGTAYIRPAYQIAGRPDLQLVLVCVIADGEINFKSLYLERNVHWAVQGN